MARVFLSYRRADGRYAVGWIAERLGRLDEVTDLRSAFQDGDLRAGDDFPAALAGEIDECDVFVAVIGPNWLGRRDHGSNRIQDPSDWVGREVSSALLAGKRVVPVLVDGAEPLRADDLREDLRGLADLHALPFNDESDLDLLVEHVRSHLADIDEERARIAGLERPIELRQFRPGPAALAAAVIAAALGALAGLAITQLAPGDADLLAGFQRHDDLWTGAVVAEMGLWGALGALGHFYLWTHFVGVVRVRWRPVLVSYAFAVLLFAWAVGAFAEPPPLEHGALRMWLLLVLAVVLLAPWILTLLGAAWTTPTAARHELGGRARLIGELDRASWIAAGVLIAGAIPAVVVSGSLGLAQLESMVVAQREAHVVITFGVFLSGSIGAATVWSRSQLRNDSTALAHDLADLAPAHRRHAEAVLVESPLDVERWWLLAWIALPALVAVPMGLWV